MKKNTSTPLCSNYCGISSRPLHIFWFLLLLLLMTGSAHSRELTPAFPGAEGGGALSVGGRRGEIIEVTTLEDNAPSQAVIPGSFRFALEKKGRRIVVFRVSGTILLKHPIQIKHPYITIAGQTAPGGGILIRGTSVNSTMISIHTHDVTMRYLRLRRGKTTNKIPYSVIAMRENSYNIMLDHLSVSWTEDENITIWPTNKGAPPHNITISRCIIAEPLNQHPVNLIVGTGIPDGSINRMVDIDIHHNLFINSRHRNPLLNNKSTRLVSNIIYNWGWYATGITAGIHIDIINNAYIPGPMTDSPERKEISWRPLSPTCCSTSGSPSIFISGNRGPSQKKPDQDNWNMLEATVKSWRPRGPALAQKYQRKKPLPQQLFAITATKATSLDDQLLTDVGASHRLNSQGQRVYNSDAVDKRLLLEYRQRKGKSPAHENEVGGFPMIQSAPPYTDKDHDGMADQWEIRHHFNPNDHSDGVKDRDKDGYTNVEEFLNGTVP
jgi:pectate lyase